MLVPIANAIFEKILILIEFSKPNEQQEIIRLSKFNFLKQTIKISNDKSKEKINLYPSSPIIINAVNEILVDQFLKQNIQYNSIYKHLLMVLNDRNYKKYAVKKPKTISQIFKIDHWSRNLTYKKLNKNV